MLKFRKAKINALLAAASAVVFMATSGVAYGVNENASFGLDPYVNGNFDYDASASDDEFIVKVEINYSKTGPVNPSNKGENICTRVIPEGNKTWFSKDSRGQCKTFSSISTDGNYWFLLKITDNNGGTFSTSGTTKVDRVSPSSPTLQASGGNGKIDLSWTASSDGSGTGIRFYKLFRDGSNFRDVPSGTTSYTDFQSANSTFSHSYYVVAEDLAGNTSGPSNTVSASYTQPAPPPPTIIVQPPGPTPAPNPGQTPAPGATVPPATGTIENPQTNTNLNNNSTTKDPDQEVKGQKEERKNPNLLLGVFGALGGLLVLGAALFMVLKRKHHKNLVAYETLSTRHGEYNPPKDEDKSTPL